MPGGRAAQVALENLAVQVGLGNLAVQVALGNRVAQVASANLAVQVGSDRQDAPAAERVPDRRRVRADRKASEIAMFPA